MARIALITLLIAFAANAADLVYRNMVPAIGYSTIRVEPTTLLPSATGGAFRILCKPSHMSTDDPVVYPNQKGAAHHHTFYGNTSTNYASDLNNMSSVGNSTCNGGVVNRSAYWMPSMINTGTNRVVLPDVAIFYYKTGNTPSGQIKVPPKGLRMISGNGKATSEAAGEANYTCAGRTPFFGWTRSIPNCKIGETMQMSITFPQCWDGKNLDSPDHKSHMANSDRRLTTANRCPSSHSIAIPNISVHFNFIVTEDTGKWRLSSDHYSSLLPGGYSGHADWVNGWNPIFITTIVKNCLNKGVDCHASLLGDGRRIY